MDKRILISHKKEWNFPICNNMDGLKGHYAKWNKLDREKQTIYQLYVEFGKLSKLVNITKSSRVTNIENKLPGVTSGDRKGGRGNKV